MRRVPAASEGNCRFEATEEQINENLQHYKDIGEFRDKSYEGALRYYTSPHQLSFVSHDPAEYISKVKCPILVMFGEKDKHVTIEKNYAPLMHAMADSMTKDLTVRIVADADHVYTTFALNPHRDVLPERLHVMTDWIRSRVENVHSAVVNTPDKSAPPATGDKT